MNALLRLVTFVSLVGAGAFLLVAVATPISEPSSGTNDDPQPDVTTSQATTGDRGDENASRGSTSLAEVKRNPNDGKEVKDPKDGKTFLEPEGKEVKEVLEPIGEGPVFPGIVTGPSAGGGPAVLPPALRVGRTSTEGPPPVVEPPDLPDTDVFTRR